MLPKAAVVCILLAFLSAGSQGNKEANYHRAARKERFLQFDRQPKAFRRDPGTCLSGEYYRRLRLLHCDEKYIQEVFNEIETSNCTNEYYNDTLFFSGCGTNHNGDVCAGIKFSLYYDLYSQCHRLFDTGDSDCSSGCETALRRLSDSVGCCIHNDLYARMPSVWKNCDVQQPEVCADTPNTADILAKRNVDPCTEKCSLRQLLYVFCKNLDEEYEKIDRDCGMDFEDVVCGFDNGEFCATMDDPTSYLVSIPDECYSKESNVRDGVCSANCRNILEEYIVTVGCCVNFFNSSSFNVGSTVQVLSSDLFSACGIEVPDACNSFSSVTVPDDFLECAGRTIYIKVNNINNGKVNNTNNSTTNNTINNSAAALQSGVYSIGLIIIGLIGILTI